MTLDNAIEMLEELRRQFGGNVKVEVRDERGEFEYLENAMYTEVERYYPTRTVRTIRLNP